MTPLDDELRRTLQAQADSLAPSPDPLAGIEARARRIRRRRAAGAALSAAAAVAAVALVVPAVVGDRGSVTPRLASPSATAPTPPGVLDPARPWALRGDGTLLADGTLDTVQREWARRHPGSTLTPMFVQTWEPSGQVEVAFMAAADGELRVGWVVTGEPGPDFVQDEVSKAPDAAYQFALPGDEGVTRLYVIAAPDSVLTFAADGSRYAPMTLLAPGVGVTAVETSGARVRVTASDGAVVYEADARGSASPAAPENVVDWPARGDTAEAPSTADVVAALERENPAETGRAHYRPLFSGATDGGMRFTVGQAWFDGAARAETVHYATRPGAEPVLQQYGAFDPGPAVVALLTAVPGMTVDVLVVVPAPGTGQVSYSPDASGSFRPVTGQDHLDGVVLIDRARGELDDRLEVLDGDGDLDRPLFRGPVAHFLETRR